MPTYLTKPDGSREQADQATIKLPAGLQIDHIVVRHGEVSFFDAQGREAVLVQRGSHPGAGMCVDFADHVVTDL